ncbi:unnamed protein product, partial [Oppiella nova]
WEPNNELEYYTANNLGNARVEKGRLVIEAKVESMGGREFTSARLNSRNAWTYGLFECRARLPKGKDLWPAIWLSPQNNTFGTWPNSGEIDIMEYSGQVIDTIAGTIHYKGVGDVINVSKGSGNIKFNTDFSAAYHIFGLKWDKYNITWLLDGKPFHSEYINTYLSSPNSTTSFYQQKGEPFNMAFHWIVNIAVGGNYFPTNIYGPQVTPAEGLMWEKPTM